MITMRRGLGALLYLACQATCEAQMGGGSGGVLEPMLRSWKQLEVDGGDAMERDLRDCRLGQSMDPSRCGEVRPAGIGRPTEDPIQTWRPFLWAWAAFLVCWRGWQSAQTHQNVPSTRV